MRFGYYKNRDLEGHKSLHDWLAAQLDIAAQNAPDFEEIVFILPLTDTRFRLRDRSSIPAFRKKIKECVAGLGVQATRNAKRQVGAV